MGDIHAKCGLHVITGSRTYRYCTISVSCIPRPGLTSAILIKMMKMGGGQQLARSKYLLRMSSGSIHLETDSWNFSQHPIFLLPSGRSSLLRNCRPSRSTGNGSCCSRSMSSIAAPVLRGERSGMSDGCLTLIGWVYFILLTLLFRYPISFILLSISSCVIQVSLFYPPISHQSGYKTPQSHHLIFLRYVKLYYLLLRVSL